MIGLRVGRDLTRTKMLKHFELTIEDNAFSYRIREDEIAKEAALDGIYVIRTNVPAAEFSAERTVAAYKELSRVESAFRSLKTTQLQLRPIYHWKDDRIRAHVFLCMLAYYVEWHMRRALRPVLFVDHEREAAEKTRASIVTPAPRSDAASRKDQAKRTDDGTSVQSFRSRLKDLATICRNTIRWKPGSDATFARITIPTDAQKQALELLGVSLDAAM